jgi:predicted alpha-1,2-mannosidase
MLKKNKFTFMRFKLLLASLVLLALKLNAQTTNKTSLTKYIDPLIGSAKHGHVFVGANVPFGAIQLGPNNIFEGWDWCSGYNYISNTITGFSHTHLSGTGIGDMGDLLIMPVTGNQPLERGTKEAPEKGWLSTFSHQNEVAKAGYYSVVLDKYNVKAELTATERVGYHKYTFNKDADKAKLILDLSEGIGWDKSVKTHFKQIDDRTITGYRLSTGWAKDQRLYFVIKLSHPIKNITLSDSTSVKNGNDLTGLKLRAVLDFNLAAQNVLEAKVAISPVSESNAILNLNAEIPAWNFNELVKKADSKWENELNKVKISASENTKKIFYTALYHTMIAPSVFNDVNGDYRGSDFEVYKKANFTNYTTFSLWDTYRAANPLYAILHPKKVPDIVNTMLAIYKQQGKLPVWHLMGNETNTMVGYHAVPVIVDAYLKGFRGFDIDLAYEAIKHSSNQNYEGIQFPKNLTYIPADSLIESVGKGLEYAIDDYCISLMAKSLNKTADYEYYLKRAKLYAQYFDPKTQFMRGKMANGSWRTPFDPFSSKHREDDYVEGNAWQYTWLVPQDVEGLIKLFGGDKPFTKKLDSLFTLPLDLGNEGSPDISGLIGNYAQGNEPNHHIPYMYVYAGQPWKTAELIRKIDEEFYTSKPDGLCGNEDVGQMSAWYIFSALGFYPVNPANGAYVFGSPLVNDAEITLAGNKKFKVQVINNNATNKYIQKIVLNDKPYVKSFLNHKDLAKGGSLKIYMGAKPSKTWGVNKQDRPTSF